MKIKKLSKIILIVVIAASVWFGWSVGAYAKLLPRFQTRAKATTSGRSGYYTSVRLRADRLALNVSFNNLQQISSISYLLSYQTNGQDEGAGGTIEPSGSNSLSRELLFGTCSAGICRYHSNITGAKLEVTTIFTNGKQVKKRYRIKV